jgi:glycerol dehydrogenase
MPSRSHRHLALVGSHLKPGSAGGVGSAPGPSQEMVEAQAPHIFGGPARYIQGPGTIERSLLPLAAEFGASAPVLDADPLVHALLCARCEALRGWRWHRFGGECSAEEIARVVRAAGRCDLIVGAGGGKAIDAAKGAQIELGCPLIVVPTVAATDAPTSRGAVLYTEGAHSTVVGA